MTLGPISDQNKENCDKKYDKEDIWKEKSDKLILTHYCSQNMLLCVQLVTCWVTLIRPKRRGNQLWGFTIFMLIDTFSPTINDAKKLDSFC